ncbi:ATP-dependent DNA helicase [Legionella sp. 16cNR16C]|uniref:ATP-dependent DNA helicase n=1 Tax=Legionella sp. 16cNR16C TaxID=2905656 RepID=UPI00351D7A83
MSTISINSDPIAHCRRLFSENGRLTTAIPGFVARTAQIDLAVAIAESIEKSSILIAEAGTGTGKTFAYLVPCLLSGKKTLISTATKTLQDQLYQKDLPNLIKALGLSLQVQNLKGRANYICRHRTELHAQEGRFSHPQAVHDLIFIREKLPLLQSGERSELPEINEDAAVWPYATSTADNCLGSECEYYKDCFLVKARKKALDADLVVINHHLFFADSQLKEEGFGELLPGVEVVVFDEAHQLAEIAALFNSERFSTRQLIDAANELMLEWPVLDLPNQPFKELTIELDKTIDQLLLAIAREDEKMPWEQVIRQPLFKKSWDSLLTILDDFITAIEKSGSQEQKGIGNCLMRLKEFKSLILRISDSNQPFIRWIERFKHSLTCHATPFEVAKSFRKLISRQQAAYIFTSATLTLESSFNCFLKPLGLENAETMILPSPFNYQEQALLYLPRDLPDPKHSRYYESLLEKALPVINACKGRCFFLFTSHRALKMVAQLLGNTLNYPLLIQGDEAKPILLARFRQLGNAVLLGTATFWEGVDVKGSALSCVIIDKLPFASPTDPVIRGKMAYLKSQGLSGFDELSLPNAVLALKQGVGRLIRDIDDRGVLMIADPRLTGRDYGRQIFSSLPSLRKTRDEKTVLSFIEQLALDEEIIEH